MVVHRRLDPDGLLGGAFSGVRRDSSYSSGGKTEDSLGRACVGPPRDDATAHRTWDHGRRSSSSSSSPTHPSPTPHPHPTHPSPTPTHPSPTPHPPLTHPQPNPLLVSRCDAEYLCYKKVMWLYVHRFQQHHVAPQKKGHGCWKLRLHPVIDTECAPLSQV